MCRIPGNIAVEGRFAESMKSSEFVADVGEPLHLYQIARGLNANRSATDATSIGIRPAHTE
jgi:hypothetical protein